MRGLDRENVGLLEVEGMAIAGHAAFEEAYLDYAFFVFQFVAEVEVLICIVVHLVCRQLVNVALRDQRTDVKDVLVLL